MQWRKIVDDHNFHLDNGPGFCRLQIISNHRRWVAVCTQDCDQDEGRSVMNSAEDFVSQAWRRYWRGRTPPEVMITHFLSYRRTSQIGRRAIKGIPTDSFTLPLSVITESSPRPLLRRRPVRIVDTKPTSFQMILDKVPMLTDLIDFTNRGDSYRPRQIVPVGLSSHGVIPVARLPRPQRLAGPRCFLDPHHCSSTCCRSHQADWVEATDIAIGALRHLPPSAPLTQTHSLIPNGPNSEAASTLITTPISLLPTFDDYQDGQHRAVLLQQAAPDGMCLVEITHQSEQIPDWFQPLRTVNLY